MFLLRQTQGENRVESDSEIVVVAAFGEGIREWRVGVGSADETESKRDRFSDDGFAVVHL